jgi:hypothetical protein
MRYVMKQKLFSWGDDFYTRDAEGREVFFVDGKATAIGRLPYNDEPKWVSGRLGSLTLEPPITHPGLCPCKQCPAYREKRAARLGLPIQQVNREPIDIRVKRNSPFPRCRRKPRGSSGRLARASLPARNTAPCTPATHHTFPTLAPLLRAHF